VIRRSPPVSRATSVCSSSTGGSCLSRRREVGKRGAHVGLTQLGVGHSLRGNLTRTCSRGGRCGAVPWELVLCKMNGVFLGWQITTFDCWRTQWLWKMNGSDRIQDVSVGSRYELTVRDAALHQTFMTLVGSLDDQKTWPDS
jgi:hypothetical protein